MSAFKEAERCSKGRRLPERLDRLVYLLVIFKRSSLQDDLLKIISSLVCAIERIENKIEHTNITGDTIPIAGKFGHTIGGHLDPKWTRLKGSASSADRDKEGLRLEIHGGKDNDGNKQMAIMEFLCPAKQEERRRSYQALTAEDEDDKNGEEDGMDKSGEETDDGDGGTIKLLSWDNEDNTKTLRLKWDTKRACEDAAEEGSGSSKGHWGFFTWFILMFVSYDPNSIQSTDTRSSVFMAVAAYLIFSSWLNYNRYSARGWDLVPHSDTIRDLPYLFRDWIRRVVDTVQGGGSRGGYSAV